MSSQPTSPPADLAQQRAAIAHLEARLWAAGGDDETLLAAYQSAWRQWESMHAACGDDRRHHFVLIIPVADSPVHLKACLHSLLELCRAFGYGGCEAGRWRKVSVLLADDSGEAGVIAQNRAIAREFDAHGLTVHYFGLEEQLALMDKLDGIDLAASAGKHARTAFHHKGQAMMRNIAYLKCADMPACSLGEPVLFYTFDADQEFKVKIPTAQGGRDVLAVNFLFHLDEIFRTRDISVLTGKVVGDPPVSPAVMAGNFLEDVLGFLRELAHASPDAPYRQPQVGGGGEAAYHDMADLFGFQRQALPYRYRCPLSGEPDNAACFAEFARHLNSFFHGEHPTRVTWYQHEEVMASVQPARTIYTGNYVFRPESLGWFIPFAALRLRMSGPTMGRMLKAHMGARFVSANLPMLHKRTLENTGQSEFRPGVHDSRACVDLCGEFERQFHGDVMLFSMERLTAQGYLSSSSPGYPRNDSAPMGDDSGDFSEPGAQRFTSPDAETVRSVLFAMQGEMREKYRIKQHALLANLSALDALLSDQTGWWHARADLHDACAAFQRFAANLLRNFGEDSPCWQRIDDAARRDDWCTRQGQAILGFGTSRHLWESALARLRRPGSVH